MSGWSDAARATIARVHMTLSEAATLKERKAAIDAAYPFGPRSHWPYKAWCKARREYLTRFGYRARYTRPTPMEQFLASHERDPETGRPVIR